MYTLYRETVIETDLETAWGFISTPANLNRITPPDMDFEICSKLSEKMHEGMLVEYRVKIPVIGTQSWLSELKYIEEQKSFVDEQKIGPYRFWYHYHLIEPCENGTLFTDRITYAVPFGIIGKLAHMLFIRKTLNRIFDYRRTMLHELLNSNTR